LQAENNFKPLEIRGLKQKEKEKSTPAAPVPLASPGVGLTDATTKTKKCSRVGGRTSEGSEMIAHGKLIFNLAHGERSQPGTWNASAGSI